MLHVGDVISCQYCGELLEIEESDLNFKLNYGSFGSEIYVQCPCCGKPAYTEGTIKLF